jgi:hypothetical protein
VRGEIEAKEADRLDERESRRYLSEQAARAYVYENLPAEAVGYRTLEPPAERDLLDLPNPTEPPANLEPATAPPTPVATPAPAAAAPPSLR